MGWQGVDLRIFRKHPTNNAEDVNLFWFEADPDDTCVCRKKSKKLKIIDNVFTLHLQLKSNFNINIKILNLDTNEFWTIKDIDFPHCYNLMDLDFEKSEDSSLYFTSSKANWQISVSIEYNGDCYVCAQSDHSICSGCLEKEFSSSYKSMDSMSSFESMSLFDSMDSICSSTCGCIRCVGHNSDQDVEPLGSEDEHPIE